MSLLYIIMNTDIMQLAPEEIYTFNTIFFKLMLETSGQEIPPNFDLSHVDRKKHEEMFSNFIGTVRGKCLGLYSDKDKSREMHIYKKMIHDDDNQSFLIEMIRQINYHGKLPEDDDLWNMMCHASLLYWGINLTIYG